MWQVILVDELLKFFSRRVKGKYFIFPLVCSSNAHHECVSIDVDYLFLCSSLCNINLSSTVSTEVHDIFIESDINILIFQVKVQPSDSELTTYYQRVIHGNSSCSFFFQL